MSDQESAFPCWAIVERRSIRVPRDAYAEYLRAAASAPRASL